MHYVKLPKDKVEMILLKLSMKRNVLLRAFLINYIAIFATWILSMTWPIENLLIFFMSGSPELAEIYMLNLIGIWKILTFAFFLAPALAAWWEMHFIQKHAK